MEDGDGEGELESTKAGADAVEDGDDDGDGFARGFWLGCAVIRPFSKSVSPPCSIGDAMRERKREPESGGCWVAEEENWESEKTERGKDRKTKR